MNEVLLKKIKYLLEYKVNEEIESKYYKLLEKLLYSFLVDYEEIYNNDNKTQFYNNLLNKINDNIRSIIIPSERFYFHEKGFLELNTDLADMLKKYKKLNIAITPNLKEEVLKKNYFYYFLLSIKTVKGSSYLDDYINHMHSIEIAKLKKYYKNSFNVICPDGTKYNYFMYSRVIGLENYEIINMMNILEVIIGKDKLMDYYLNNNMDVILDFNKEYDSILGDMRFDSNGRMKYNAFTIINELSKRFIKEQGSYKKTEYLKKLNLVLFEMFNYKLTKVLNSKDEESIRKINSDLKVLEENMLYNVDSRLNSNLEHIKIFKTMKIKLANYLTNDKKNIRNKYTIYSEDKKRSDKVTSSVQPIKLGNTYVLVSITDIKNINNRVLVRINFQIIDYDNMRKKNYENIYISLKEIKHLFSTSDLGVITRESEVIRNAIANRIVDQTIMRIIINERNSYLGDFSYDKDLDQSIIYKNQSITDYLGKNKIEVI